MSIKFKYSENNDNNMNWIHFALQTYVFTEGLKKGYLPQFEFPAFFWTGTNHRFDIMWLKRLQKSGKFYPAYVFEIEENNAVEINEGIKSLNLFINSLEKPCYFFMIIYSIPYPKETLTETIKLNQDKIVKIQTVGNGECPINFPQLTINEWIKYAKEKWSK